MIKNLSDLAERLKGVKISGEEETLSTEKLLEKINSEEEFTIEVDEVNLLTNEEFKEVKENVGKESAKKGANTIVEMWIKEKRDELGFELPKKDLESLVNAVREKAVKETKSSNKDVESLKETIENLRGTITEKDGEIEKINENFDSYKKNVVAKDKKMKNIPEGLNGIKPEHFLAAATADGIDIDFDDDGNEFATINGKPVKDKLEKYVSVKDVLTDFAENNGWINGEGGSGEGDYTGGKAKKFKTIDDVYAYMDENNINPIEAAGEKLIKEFEASTQAS